ncbi:FtsX-like permease family protein [Cellulomonas phragmiteti]|uniref:ABC3 transporter permease C-terminal domain-containing protein n=1 Tax=Cellulomonas phragmiteti TaxID=478780 RepID=A0ABQ4DM52_9CELL|nr:FtsX-like permease family protein [Cellulomonas phragmiteti]GIG40430.1 hypothetical protein Cph01nite_21920 [Cellulomonas phragmiteti]
MTTTTARLRATGGDALLVTRRRARQDAGLLAGTALLLTSALLAVLAAPVLLERTADEALRASVANAGAGAAVQVVAPLDRGDPTQPFAATFRQAVWLDGRLPGLLPATAVSASPPFTASGAGAEFTTRLVTLETPSDPSAPVRWTVGREPAAVLVAVETHREVEVGLSVDAARDLGVDPSAGPVTIEIARRDTVHLAHVTGLYEPVDPGDPRWVTVPDLLGPAEGAAPGGAAATVALYVPPAARDDMAWVLGSDRLPGPAVALVDAADLTVADAHRLRRDLVAQLVVEPRLASGFPQLVDAFDAHAGAVRAQASLVVAGVGATAACCLVLAAALLVERRRTHLAAERARGASLASVALRSAVESLPTALVAVLVAGVVVTVWLGGPTGPPWPAAVVTAVAAVAPAVLAVRAAAGAWAGRRVPADRRERARLAGLRRARRLVLELLAVAVAVTALLALRGRGLVPSGPPASDPLLPAAPFLLAVAASLVVVRVAPTVVRAAARWASRSRGLAAPLAVTRAQRAATALLPLVTVTVAVALMVLAGGLVQHVRDGQRVAAAQLVGADLRLDGPLGTDAAREALAQLAGADGVQAVATGAQIEDRAYGRGTGLTATVLAVDTAALAAVREARGLPVDPGLAGLADATAGRVPALVTADLLARAGTADTTLLQVLADHVELDVRGTTTLVPDRGAPPVDVRAAHATLSLDDGVVVVDREVLLAASSREVPATRAWVAGPGAERAATDLRLADLSEVTVTTAEGWWRAWSRAPLPTALTTLLLAAVGALALLAVVGLALVVVATSGERGRTLSTLRTLGLDARTARWATLGELAPLVVGGLVGGSAIGLALPALVGGTLGLRWVTAAPGDVPMTPTWWPVLLAAGALVVALVVAVTVEQAVRRRQRLGEVLRVGAR